MPPFRHDAGQPDGDQHDHRHEAGAPVPGDVAPGQPADRHRARGREDQAAPAQARRQLYGPSRRAQAPALRGGRLPDGARAFGRQLDQRRRRIGQQPAGSQGGDEVVLPEPVAREGPDRRPRGRPHRQQKKDDADHVINPDARGDLQRDQEADPDRRKDDQDADPVHPAAQFVGDAPENGVGEHVLKLGLVEAERQRGQAAEPAGLAAGIVAEQHRDEKEPEPEQAAAQGGGNRAAGGVFVAHQVLGQPRQGKDQLLPPRPGVEQQRRQAVEDAIDGEDENHPERERLGP